MKHRFLKLSEVIDDIISLRDYGHVNIDELNKISSDFLRKIETDEQLVHRVALLPVKDHAARIPVDHSILLQIAYRPIPIVCGEKKIKLTKWIQETYDGSGCKYEITLDCPECHKESCDHNGAIASINIDDIWRQQHPEYQYMHMNQLYRWGGVNKENLPNSIYTSEFQLIKYAQHNFTNADYHIGGCLNLDAKLMSGCQTEYTVHNGVIKINREAGDLLVAYMGHQLCEKGYHMVPDIPEVIEGLKWYFEELMSYREYRRSKQRQDLEAFKIAQQQRKILQGVIHELLQTPSYDAWMSFLANNWKRTVKNNNYYGDMNQQAPRDYSNMLTNLTQK